METSAPPRIFSQTRRVGSWHRARSRQAGGSAARYLYDDAIEDIEERLDFMQANPKRALVIGDATSSLATRLAARGAEVRALGPDDLDEEEPYPEGGFDLIVHLFTLATVNDLPGALIHARAALAQGGLLFASFPGAGSLARLRQIMLEADGDRPAPRMHPLVDPPAASALMQRAGFARQVVDSHAVSVSYSSLETLVSDLRDHGLTSVLRTYGPSLSKSQWDTAKRAFQRLSDEGGKLIETYEMLTLTGWKS